MLNLNLSIQSAIACVLNYLKEMFCERFSRSRVPLSFLILFNFQGPFRPLGQLIYYISFHPLCQELFSRFFLSLPPLLSRSSSSSLAYPALLVKCFLPFASMRCSLFRGPVGTALLYYHTPYPLVNTSLSGF